MFGDPAHDSVPVFVRGSGNTVALRMPDHPALRAVARFCSGIFSTSANIAGVPVPQTIDAVDTYIMSQVSHCVYDEVRLSLPSTIIDASGSQICVVREGAVTVPYPKCN